MPNPAAVRKKLKIWNQISITEQCVAEKLVFHEAAVARARELLVSHLQKEERLESVKFKYLLDTTRKFAIPLLEHFDREGVTVRSGNVRLKGRGRS